MFKSLKNRIHVNFAYAMIIHQSKKMFRGKKYHRENKMKLFLLVCISVSAQNCDRPEEKISGFCGKRQDTLNAKAGYDKATERYLVFGFQNYLFLRVVKTQAILFL